MLASDGASKKRIMEIHVFTERNMFHKNKDEERQWSSVEQNETKNNKQTNK